MLKVRVLFQVALCVVFVLLFALSADAQCAMCKASLESNSRISGSNLSGGINNGILYLMGIPYLIIGSLALFFYREPLLKKWKEFRS